MKELGVILNTTICLLLWPNATLTLRCTQMSVYDGRMKGGGGGWGGGGVIRTACISQTNRYNPVFLDNGTITY